MPSLLRTRTEPIHDHAYVVSTTRIRVQSPRAALTLLRRLGPVRSQLGNTPGLAVFGLRAQLLRLTFTTYGVFDDRRALAAFVRSAAHDDAMKALSGQIARFESRMATLSGGRAAHELADDHRTSLRHGSEVDGRTRSDVAR